MSRTLRFHWAASNLAGALIGTIALAGGPGEAKYSPVQAPQASAETAPQVVTRTVMVPETTYQTVTQQQVVCRPVVRQKTVPVTRVIPEAQTVSKLVTVQVPEQRTRTETYFVSVPVPRELERSFTVMVPEERTRTETFTVLVPR